MDIDILLWLQEVRLSMPPALQAFFTFLGSDGVIVALLVIPCFAYWCLDKRRGTLALVSYGLGSVANQLLKNTFCVYRPWIRDASIVPDKTAIKGATGYSFPSGHTQSTASIVGGVGWAWRDKRRWPLALSVALTLLMALSRTVLGVHTPQDVLVGMLVGVLSILAAERLLEWIDGGEGRDLLYLVISLVVLALFILYVTFKPYPMDYVGGVLVVDPAEMTVDSYKSAGGAAGIALGLFAERRWVRFETQGLTKRRMAIRMVLGLALLAVLHVPVGHAFVSLLGDSLGQFVRNLVSFSCSIALTPACFRLIESRIGVGDAVER